MKYIIAIFFFILVTAAYCQKKNKTENVVLVTLDGFRWQEVFNGADSSFMKQQEHLKDKDVKLKYWKDDIYERRTALLPFFWNTIAKKGQLYGNRQSGSKVNVTNQMWFSYPGYNEILTGHADDERITSNDKNYNPNSNVLEYINQQPAYKGRVAAFTSWDCFPFIINDKRSGVFVSAGLVKAEGETLSDREKMLNEVLNTVPNPLGDVRFDAYTFYYGLEYMKKNRPRIMYFGFDETDDFAHSGEYAAYLNAANYTDKFIGELWDFLQSHPQYKDKTTLMITSDHGRGPTTEDWKHHGRKIEHADEIWFAVLGPDTPATGEVKVESQYYQNQIAKTLASFLGLDYNNESKAGDAVVSMLRK